MELKNWDYDEFPEYAEKVDGAGEISTTGNELAVYYTNDVEYENVQGISLHLQILRPDTRNRIEEKLPVVVFVHGSAWMEQNVYFNLPQFSKLAGRGIVVAVVQYRHSGQAAFPAQIQDAREAVRFMKGHAEEYGADEDRVFLAGDSSGGHTAMMAGIAEEGSIFDLHHDNKISAEVKGIIDLYGSVSVLYDDDNPSTVDHCLPTSPEGMVMGGKNLREDNELRKKLSVISYISAEKKIPGTLIMHGTKDFIVNTTQSVRLYRKLLECGKETSLYLIKGAIHGGGEFWTENVIDIMERFIKS